MFVVLAACALRPGDAAAAAPPLAWEVVDRPTPLVVWANRSQVARMRIRNLGSSTWSEATGDRLSYHWITPAGAVVAEGPRTLLPSPVPPGATVELTAKVLGPERAGPWVLEWAMVREQVCWYRPPASGESARVRVRVWWRCSLLQLAFALGSVVLLLLVRSRRPGEASLLWVPLGWIPFFWTWLAGTLTVYTVAELVGRNPAPDAFRHIVAGAVLLALPALLVPVRWRPWAAAAAATAISVVAAADLLHLRFFGGIVPVSALAAFGQLRRIEASVRALFVSSDGWLLPMPVAGFALALLLPLPPLASARAGHRRAAWAATSLLAVAALALVTLSLPAALADPGLTGSVFSEELVVGRWGILNAHVFDMARSAREWWQQKPVSRQQRAWLERSLDARAAAARPSAWFGAARGANLVLIQVESFQRWVVGATVGGVEITPFLNSLRDQGLFFSSVFDETEYGRSSDGEFIALNSQYPLSRGAVVFRRAYNHFVALPGVLKRHGYATVSAHPFDRGFWNRAVTHPRFGFDRMLFRQELGPGEVIGWGLADQVFFDRVSPELPKLPRPFFAMMITLGLHHPFDQFPNRHKQLDVGPLKDTPLGNYIHAMHYFDASLASFVASLERAGLRESTVVALYGDHEAGLGSGEEMRAIADAGPPRASTEVLLWKVPFFVLLPGNILAGERSTPGGQVDIAPTLLDLLGIDRPRCFLGASLLADRPFPAEIRGRSGVRGDMLFVGLAIEHDVAGGACFSFPSGDPRRLVDCGGLAAAIDAEREISRLIVEHDLASDLAALDGHG